MNTKRKQRYLYIDGEAIPVTEKVYRAFWHYEDKEDYWHGGVPMNCAANTLFGS